NARVPMTRLSGLMSETYGVASRSSLDRRFDDAENSLVSFAMETGGQAFLKGMSAERIAEEILGDMDCVYLISFDPEDFPTDRSLRVRVAVNRPGVEIRARGLMTIRSESGRLTSELEAAFAAPEEVRGSKPLGGVMIPTGFEGGKYTALAQLIIPGSAQPRVDWDVGLSLLSRNRIREAASGRISVRGKDVPVVFEAVVRLAPGPWELTGVAHDSVTGEISAFRVEGDWPDPMDERAVVGPIALLQPVYAAFLRDGETRRKGSLGRVGTEPIRTDLPTALVGLVCRNRSERGTLSIERRLVGQTLVKFPSIELTPDRERCTIVSDVIPAGTMTSGLFRYELVVSNEEEDVASGIRELAALEPNP
ncbi:MAG: hypothetical protein O7A63_11095, partial [Acidobacteria bacterium]|nr:hypothetical protein [Acidobacteriota bacterium]